MSFLMNYFSHDEDATQNMSKSAAKKPSGTGQSLQRDASGSNVRFAGDNSSVGYSLSGDGNRGSTDRSSNGSVGYTKSKDENRVNTTSFNAQSRQSSLSSDHKKSGGNEVQASGDIDNMLLNDEGVTTVSTNGSIPNIGRSSSDLLGDVEEGESQDGSMEDDSSVENNIDEMMDSAYYNEVGDMTCCCKPTRVTGCNDLTRRTLQWVKLNRNQLLAGITVAVGQVPEVASYALIAGVDPILALRTTWIMGIITALVGGRSGMISGATAASAIALVNLVETSGKDYIFYAVMLAGLAQMAFGILQLGRLIRLIPHPVMIGFVNSAAFIVAISQIRYLKERDAAVPGDGRDYEISHHTNAYNVLLDSAPWVDNATLIAMLVEAGCSFLLCLLLPKVTRIVPSSLVAIVLVTAAEWAIVRMIGFKTPLIADEISTTSTYKNYPWPAFLDDEVAFPGLSLDTLNKIWPTSLSIFAVTLAESLLTFQVVGDFTETFGSASRMAFGQGLGQFVSGLLGGMGGGGMVGQTVVNNRSDGITGVSCFVAGLSMFVILMGAKPAVDIVPVSALIGVMYYAAFTLVQFKSFVHILAGFFPQKIRDVLYLDCKVNRSNTVIMLAVMGFAFFYDLAIAVIVGVTISTYTYSWDTSTQLIIDRVIAEDEKSVTYIVKGPIFFGSTRHLLESFTKETETIIDDPDDVILMLENAEVTDWSGMVALKTLYDRISSLGKTVALSSLSSSSKSLMEKNSSMWYGVVFLEMQELDEEELSFTKSVTDDNDQEGNIDQHQLDLQELEEANVQQNSDANSIEQMRV